MSTECPFVDRSFIPAPIELNRPCEFECDDGTVYVFYDHDDGFGVHSNVQFCQLIGRKRDVFECLNEREWRACGHYLRHYDSATMPGPEEE